MRTRTSLFLCVLAVLAIVAVQPARAALYTWDNTGTGTWDTTAANWTGASGTPWDATNGPSNTAEFTGSGDVAGISGNIYAWQINIGATSVSSTATLNGTGGIANINQGVYVGSSSINNTLNISGTARVAGTGTGNPRFNIGDSTFGGNSVVISAPGTTDAPTVGLNGSSAQINIGVSSSNNSLTVQDSAYVKHVAGSGTLTWTIGTNNGADNNSMTVTGTNSTINKASSGSHLVVGAAGSSNYLKVAAGGTLLSGRVSIGTNGGSNNYELITGDGSTYTTSGSSNQFMNIGQTSGSNTNSLRVADGGTVNFGGSGTSRQIAVGQVAGANSNYISITGVSSTSASSTLNFVHTGLPLAIGGLATGSTISDGGTGNHLDVYSGGTLDMDNLDGANTKIPTGSSAIVLAGTSTSFNLGNGTGISTAYVGTTTNFASGVYLKNADGRLNINSGRLTAGVTGALVSGAGQVQLNGPAYFSTAFVASTISNVIAGAGDLTKEGTGTLKLSGANIYTGDTIVSNGTLEVTSAFFDDASSVYISGVLNLNTSGATDTILALYLGGAAQAAGTWGSSSSAATNKNDTYFSTSGTGILDVVPEPATMALLGLGGLLLGRKRR